MCKLFTLIGGEERNFFTNDSENLPTVLSYCNFLIWEKIM